MAPTSKSGFTDVRDPEFGFVPYHLTVFSPCQGFIDASVSPPSDDYDGESRPKGPRLDCGADEF